MIIAETARLRIRYVKQSDAYFIYQLLNDSSWIDNIGDKSIHTLSDAGTYIENSPQASYQKNDFGLFLLELKNESTAIGLCGLIKRQGLTYIDLGYALLPKYGQKGYALEACKSILSYGKLTHNLDTIVAITLADNLASIKLLEKLDFIFDKIITLPNDNTPLNLYKTSLC